MAPSRPRVVRGRPRDPRAFSISYIGVLRQLLRRTVCGKVYFRPCISHVNRSFDRSVELLIEGELLDLLDTIRKYSNRVNNNFTQGRVIVPWKLHRMRASPLTPLYVHAQLPCLVCASYIAVPRIAELLSRARSVSMFSLLSHASGLIGGRADERICIVGLPSTGF